MVKGSTVYAGGDFTVAGVIANVTVTQVYKNEGKKPLEMMSKSRRRKIRKHIANAVSLRNAGRIKALYRRQRNAHTGLRP